VLAGVLALGIVPFAFPASSQTDDEPVLRDITENACPEGEVPASVFTDIENTTFEAEIACVEWYDVTSGATATTYNPLGTVSRGQMATFIANLIDYVDEDALDDASDTTTDAFPCPSDPGELVPTDTHYENIQRLADADIVQGGPAGQPANCYGPDLRVSRAQMATFIAVAQTFLGEEIEPAEVAALQVDDTTTTTEAPTTTTTEAPTTTTVPGVTTTVPGVTTTTVPTGPTFANFFDDDDDSVHEDNINAIASEGIVVGTSDRMYSPRADIRRGQMAAFLARKLDYLVENNATDTPTTTEAPVNGAG
jgi:hypothetical protein